jgi:hypothetical protein
MAEYIKFRLTAAKASVTMAFFALLGGLIGPRAEAQERGPTANAASFSWGTHYLKLDGLNGVTQKVFQKLEIKLNSTFLKLNQTLTSDFYSKHKVDSTFLKIRNANAQFLKLRSANANFLKIEDANADFLKITDANQKFLKIAGTAANASELGGLTPDAFVQGHANVVSGATSITDGNSQPLLHSADGMITASVSADRAGNQFLVIHNGSSTALTAVVDPTAVEYQLPAVQDTQIPLNNLVVGAGPTTNNPTMTHVQIFPGGALNEVMTLTVSTEPPVNGGPNTAVGQMLIGLL